MATPDLEELRLSDEDSQIFLEVSKEEETLLLKLSRLFILDVRGQWYHYRLEGMRLDGRRRRTGQPIGSRFRPVLC